MKLARAVLVFAALVFFTFGMGFLLVPVQWAEAVDIALPTALARTDLRATYGGLEIGVALFLALCAVRAEWVRPGLVALMLAAGGFGAGRLAGIVVERSAGPLMLGFALLEWTIVGVTLYLLRRLDRATAG
jgi:hypothetical protein